MLSRCILRSWRACMQLSSSQSVSVRSKHNDTWDTIGHWGKANLEGIEVLRLYSLGMTKQYDTSKENVKRSAMIRQRRRFRKQQMISKESLERLGNDVAVAEMVLRIGGAVKFQGSDQWLRGSRNQLKKRALLPRDMTTGPSSKYKLEIIDLGNTPIMYEGLCYLRGLQNLQYLSLRACAFVDDHCISQLYHVRRTLLALDLSYCPYVSARGLTTLWSQRQLQRLCIEGMTVPELQEDKELACLLLEERNEKLYIEGVDYEKEMRAAARREIVAQKAERFKLGLSVGEDGKLLDIPRSSENQMKSESHRISDEEVVKDEVGDITKIETAVDEEVAKDKISDTVTIEKKIDTLETYPIGHSR